MEARLTDGDGETAEREASNSTGAERTVEGTLPTSGAVGDSANGSAGVGVDGNHHADVAGDDRGGGTDEEGGERQASNLPVPDLRLVGVAFLPDARGQDDNDDTEDCGHRGVRLLAR